MPADIRNFFGGRPDATVPKQEKPPAIKDNSGAGNKRRSKARVILDDSDDNVPLKAEKTTPKKAVPKDVGKRKSPVGEETTTADYFASNSNSKLQKSTLSKTKAKSEVPSPLTTPKKVPAHFKKDKVAYAESDGREVSQRKGAKKIYAEFNDDDEGELLDDDDADVGDDIFAADASKRSRRKNDGYVESESESEVSVVRVIKKSKSRKRPGPKESEDADMENINKSNIILDDDEILPTGRRNRGRGPSSAGRKRKSPDLGDDDDEETDILKKGQKVKDGTQKPPAKKARAKKEEPSEDVEMQAIFDSIPTIRAPTPPPRDADKKFDWKAGGPGNSGPPPAAGAKEVPIGAENCLTGLTFVFTGLLETISRDAGQELVKRYGGKVTGAPSSKTSYVILGSDAGPSKLEKIKSMNIKTISEDGLFELIRRLPASGGSGKAAEKNMEKKKAAEEKVKREAAEMEREERRQDAEAQEAVKNAATARGFSNATLASKPSSSSQLWTTKYAPTKANQICGNKGQVEKIQSWLQKWPYNRKHNFQLPGGDGSGKYRAIIIHGPPGIGKTTAAHLAAKLEGYDVIESNASDTRSKKLVESGLSEVLNNSSLLGFFAGDGKEVSKQKKKIVLIMDEVDGMSAGDRGGVGALAKVCKKTEVPMILICNERRSPKMKPFDHAAYDVIFKRPTVEQVRSRIATICAREGLKIPPQVMDALIEGSNKDIRQIINMLSTAKLDQISIDFDQGKSMSKAWEKHIVLKPWDIFSKLFGGGMFAPTSKATLNDKIELYFNDHELSFLMVQENYLSTRPILATNQGLSMKEQKLKFLELVDQSAESISDGDLVDRMIHGSQQQWSLMPTHAVFSTVRPASFMSGALSGQTSFPAWLGNNSKQGKSVRYIREIQAHMRLRTSGDRHEIRQQYLPVLWEQLIKRMEIEGKDCIEDVIKLMDSYFLTRDDWDYVMELGVGPQNATETKIEAATKSAFTRLYNTQSHPLPFMKATNTPAAQKGPKIAPDLEEAIEEDDDGDVLVEDQDNANTEENGDFSKDKYIKKPKVRKGDASKKPAAKKGNQMMTDPEQLDHESEQEPQPKITRVRKTKGTAARGKAKK